MRCYAIMHGGRVYTLKPWRDPWGRKSQARYKWRGFCDGDPCGLFVTKAEFDAFVKREPAAEPRGPHADAADRAQLYSTFEGNQILHRLIDGCARRRSDG